MSFISGLNVIRKMRYNKSQFLRLCYHEKHLSNSTEVPTSASNIPAKNPKNAFRDKLENGPNFKDFVTNNHNVLPEEEEQLIPYLRENARYGFKRKVFFDVYGCQMNVNDTEIIWSILKRNDFLKTENLNEADVVLIVTCAIRDGAEAKIWNRLDYLRGINKARPKTKSSFKVGILGCMAKRLKDKFLEHRLVDLVAGPDNYRDLPRLLAMTENNQKSVNVLLSFEETYADIMPVRLNENSVSAFVSIMRGCDNMCTYCIVPFTRGRERSRPITSILKEIEFLSQNGVKEVTLLGQNVNSYRDLSNSSFDKKSTNLAKGFQTVYKSKLGGVRFAELLQRVSEVNPEMRIRFTSPHPKDFSDDVIEVIKSQNNICKNLHMPAQSGNSEVLQRMRRGYTREAYLELVDNIKKELPNVSLSSDFICGFCGETDAEFEDTISLMDQVKYNTAYLFAYSMREKTAAYRRYTDDVTPEIKQQRLERMIETFRKHAKKLNEAQVGQVQLVLVEGPSRRSRSQLAGRNTQNIKVQTELGTTLLDWCHFEVHYAICCHVLSKLHFMRDFNINRGPDLVGIGPMQNLNFFYNYTFEEDIDTAKLRDVIIPSTKVPEVTGDCPKTPQPGDYVAVQISSSNSQVLQGIPLYRTTLTEFHSDSNPSYSVCCN